MKISGYYQIPTLHEVMSNATFINDRLPPNPPQQLDLSNGRLLLLPFMTFVCNGTITRLTYFGWLSEPSEHFSVRRLTSWPHFSLWRRCEDHHYFVKETVEIGPTDPDQLSVSMLNRNNVVVMITSSVTFNVGDILGVRLQQRNTSITNGITISVQKQSDDYDQTPVCGLQPNSSCSQPQNMTYQGRPYISIASPNQWCASDFFNQQTLRDFQASRSLYFPGIPPLAMSMPFTHCGLLRRIVILAKVNATVPVGWPVIQIIRRMANKIPCVAFTTNMHMMEPQPTPYPSVYEYDLSTENFTIQTGDVLNISWYGDVLQPDQVRFSLAYYDNGTPPGIPMVSVVTANRFNCENNSAWLAQSNLYCEETDRQPTANDTATTPVSIQTSTIIEKANYTTTSISTSQSDSSMPDTEAKSTNITVVISGVVSCSFLLSLLLILVVICVIVVRRRGKSFSVNTADSTEMNRHVHEVRPFHFVVHHLKTKAKKSSNEVSNSTVQCSSTGEVIEVDINEAYNIISNTQITTESNVAYSTPRPAQAGQSIMPHDYDYVVL